MMFKNIRKLINFCFSSSGIPSPVISEDSGTSSLGLEGIHPLNLSPIHNADHGMGRLTEQALSNHNNIGLRCESLSTSLIVEKCSPSSICSSLRKRFQRDIFESKDGWSEEIIPQIKTPKLSHESPRYKEDDTPSNFDYGRELLLLLFTYSSINCF